MHRPKSFHFLCIWGHRTYVYPGGRPNQSLPVMLPWLWVVILCSVNSGHWCHWAQAILLLFSIPVIWQLLVQFNNVLLIDSDFSWKSYRSMETSLVTSDITIQSWFTKQLYGNRSSDSSPYPSNVFQKPPPPGTLTSRARAPPLHSPILNCRAVTIKKQLQFQLISSNWAADVICYPIVGASVHL